MNTLQWLTPLLKMGRRKRRNGKGMMWASIISVIVSAIALRGLKRSQINIPKNPLKNLVSPSTKTNIQNFLNMNDRAVLSEFSKELTPKPNSVVQNVVHKNQFNQNKPQ